MTSIFDRFSNAFPGVDFPNNLFYEYEFALRFELGGEEVTFARPLKRFIQAFERADQVAVDLFRDTATLWLFCASYGELAPPSKRLEQFALCNLPQSRFSYLGALDQSDNPAVDTDLGPVFRHWDCAEIARQDQLREVLWLGLGGEVGVRPAAQVQIYLADVERGLVLHPYDDRGMDVAALDRALLTPLYHAHKPWLLEYNRPEMDAQFAGL